MKINEFSRRQKSESIIYDNMEERLVDDDTYTLLKLKM